MNQVFKKLNLKKQQAFVKARAKVLAKEKKIFENMCKEED